MKLSWLKLLLIIFLPVLIIGILVWQRGSKNKPTEHQNTTKQGEINTSDTTGGSFIESLRKRNYEPSKITIESTVSDNASYTSYIISYLSDGLKIYGRMN